VKSSVPFCPFICIHSFIYIQYHCHFSGIARLKRSCNSSVGCDVKFKQWITNLAITLLLATGTCARTPRGHPPPSGLAIHFLPCSLQYQAGSLPTIPRLPDLCASTHCETILKALRRAGTTAGGTTRVEKSEMGINCTMLYLVKPRSH